MSEQKILDYLRRYGLDCPSLDAAFAADADAAMEKVYEASYHVPEAYTPDVLELVLSRFETGPSRVFWIFHNIASKVPGRATEMMDLYERHFARFPAGAIDALYYVCANNAHLLRPALISLLSAHIAANPSQAFQALQVVLVKRPELINAGAVEAVIRNLLGQVNQAFYFIRESVKRRPEFTPLCTLALFECVLHEPHAYVRREMMQDILAIANHSHVKTALEKALHEPPRAGTHRARVLMAILFRQKFRAHQRVLLEALDAAMRWVSVWDFLMLVLDSTDPKVVSSAGAEAFLEGAYRLSLLVSPYEYEQILASKLDLRDAPPVAFPDDAVFLGEDAELLALYRRASLLASRFGLELKLAPLREFRGRAEAARRELEAISRMPSGDRLAAHRRALEERLAVWSAGGTSKEERRALLKKMRDALKAEAVRMAIDTIAKATMDAYRMAVRRVLGRDYDLGKVDAGVLPAFMYFERVSGMRNNRAYLARLIEDRLEGRPHDWLWTEPPAAAWAERLKKERPEIRLDRWRAPFDKQYNYLAKQALEEKRRRIQADLAQTRGLFAQLKVEGLGDAGYDRLRDKFLEIHAKPPEGADPPIIEEIGANLERIRIAEQTPDSDYEGMITMSVETDPFQVLFMGEYGFASCLSIRGSNAWSAISNAIDVDKVVVWARDGAGNIVARRLIALTPQGVVSYRTYTNRHGLSLDGMFEDFIAACAAHCGTGVTRRVSPGPLLSDEWYDDGAL